MPRFSLRLGRRRQNLPLHDLVLTPDQSDQLDNRRSQFDAFYAELMPVLVDFCTCLELPNPYEVLSDPTPYISPVAQWVAAQDLLAASPDDRGWLSSRIAPIQMAIDLVESTGELETYLADASTAIEASI